MYTNTLIIILMITKTLLSIGTGIAIGLSPLRNYSNSLILTKIIASTVINCRISLI